MASAGKYRVLACFLAVSALSLSACSQSPRANHFNKTNHFGGHYYPGHAAAPHQKRGAVHRAARYNQDRYGHKMMRGRMPVMPVFQQWVDHEPQYLLYPGDQIDIVVSSAPELSRTLTVGPDGRIVMPMAKPVMAAGRTMEYVQQALRAELASQLRDPTLAVTPRAYGPQQIFVGGEVGQQGTYTLPGPIGTMEAVMMAGGFRPSAKSSKIAVLRRAPNGGMMMRTVNIRGGLNRTGYYNDVIQLRRGDIVFVPKTTIAEIGEWVQAFRAALPVDFNLSYQFGTNNGGTTVISP